MNFLPRLHAADALPRSAPRRVVSAREALAKAGARARGHSPPAAALWAEPAMLVQRLRSVVLRNALLRKAVAHAPVHPAVLAVRQSAPTHLAALVLKIVSSPLKGAMAILPVSQALPAVVVVSVTAMNPSPKIPPHHAVPPSSVTAPARAVLSRAAVMTPQTALVRRRVVPDSVTAPPLPQIDRDHPVALVLQAVPDHPAVVVRRSPAAAVRADDNVPEV